ncbi:DHH family phosphoesterase [Geomonas sp. RF6]|uniref:DHH family phosphoesterase n=1 Tax=Geomonas sp. RF6 TaxID=2897342 RepID=UPI001E32C254|nr:DHH family phosphoesterase [Geomonas sp. RF6]UFS70845.1 DHH family phosphoesterase [Geomonas sp. RF6]
MKAIIADIVAAIERHHSFLVTTHEGPDGDAVGSALALGNHLARLGKDVTVHLIDPVPETYQFLPMSEQVLRHVPERQYDVCFVLDVGEFRRAGKEIAACGTIGSFINIDHHLSCENFGAINLIDPEACATGALIYRVISGSGLTPDYPTALCIYTAVISDTGSFHYSNSNPEAFAIAGAMVGLGVQPWTVTEPLFESYPKARQDLLALALSDLTVSPSGRYASITVTLEMYRRTGGSAELTDGFINYARQIKGVEVALFFREVKDGVFKVGFRSKGKVNVAELSALFGGGGHHNAAGCTVAGTLAEVKGAVFERLEQKL